MESNGQRARAGGRPPLAIADNSAKPPRGRRPVLAVASIIGRALALTAGVALVLAAVLFVLAWHVFGIPYRRLRPERRHNAQREALLALFAAAAGAYAVFRRRAPAAE